MARPDIEGMAAWWLDGHQQSDFVEGTVSWTIATLLAYVQELEAAYLDYVHLLEARHSRVLSDEEWRRYAECDSLWLNLRSWEGAGLLATRPAPKSPPTPQA